MLFLVLVDRFFCFEVLLIIFFCGVFGFCRFLINCFLLWLKVLVEYLVEEVMIKSGLLLYFEYIIVLGGDFKFMLLLFIERIFLGGV